MWDLSCPDWEDRIREGRSLIPVLPLNNAEADMGLAFFDELRLPDVPGLPKMSTACGPWFRDIVRVAFGSWFPEQQLRYIRDILMLLPKGQSKTTYIAGLLLALMLMNRRPRAEGLFIGPTQAIAENAYDKAVGMIEASADLKRRFRTRDHLKTIEDLVTHTELKIKTFDVNILTGTILIFAVLEELHLLGRNPHASKVLRQIRGGLEKTPEGLLLMPSTMPDEAPAGAFKDELLNARKIRAGDFRGKVHRPLLPVLYEFPPDIAKDKAKWQDPDNWALVMPNLGRSVHLASLTADWQTERQKGEHAVLIWASQHLNIEVGVGLYSDRWAGADYWERQADKTLTLETLLQRCEVAVASIDGGGLDDLLSLKITGREIGTRRWLSWGKNWVHRSVLKLRKDIAARLEDFAAAGELVIVDDMTEAFRDLAETVALVEGAGILPEKNSVGLDPMGVGLIVDALAEEGIEGERVVGIPQGWQLNGAIKTLEVKLACGEYCHPGQAIDAWAVGNAKVEPKGNAITITKQAAGSAKIDPLMAALIGAALMSKNPDGGRSVFDVMAESALRDHAAYQKYLDYITNAGGRVTVAHFVDDWAPIGAKLLADLQAADLILVEGGVMIRRHKDSPFDDDGIDRAILDDPRHPRWKEMRDRWERKYLAREELMDL